MPITSESRAVTLKQTLASPSMLVSAFMFVTLAVLYVNCLPTTVQELDTGEMVTNAWLLAVAHPPGMPLFMWMQHAFAHAIPVGTIFWRASLGACLYALGGLAALAFLSHTQSSKSKCVLAWFMVLIPLALSDVYWAYAVRPDVFAAHACICAMLLVSYLHAPASPRRAYTLTLVAAAGLCVHQSVAFLLPLVLHGILEARDRRVFLRCLLLGTFVVTIAYASLLLMHPEAPESWGLLQTPRDVIRHMLREDYGTWQLDGHDRPPQVMHNWFALLGALFRYTPVTLGLFLSLPVLWLRRCHLDVRDGLVFTCLLIYCGVFFSLANNPNEAILQRFFIMPFVLASAMALRAIQATTLSTRWQLILAATSSIVTISHLPETRAHNDLSQDTLIEDYARNLLTMAQVNAPQRAALVVNGDTRGYALRYVQSVLHIGTDVLVLNQGNLFGSQFRKKVALTHPDLTYAPDWNQGPHARSILAHVVEPNLERYRFTFARDATFSNYHMTYKGLGRTLSRGAGEDADVDSAHQLVMHSGPNPWPSEDYDERKDFYAEYAYVYLKAAQLASSRDAVLQAYERAVRAVPYCFVARRALCKLHPEIKERCQAEVAGLQSREFNYY